MSATKMKRQGWMQKGRRLGTKARAEERRVIARSAIYEIRLALQMGRDPAVKHEGEVTLDDLRHVLELNKKERDAIFEAMQVGDEEFTHWQRLYNSDQPNRDRRLVRR